MKLSLVYLCFCFLVGIASAENNIVVVRAISTNTTNYTNWHEVAIHMQTERDQWKNLYDTTVAERDQYRNAYLRSYNAYQNCTYQLQQITQPHPLKNLLRFII